MEYKAEPLLHITIGTHPTKELNLEQEIRLAKTALLYADQVKLYSLTASALKMASRVADLPLNYKLRVLEQVTPFISQDDESEKLLKFYRDFKKITNKRYLGAKELVLKNNIEKELAIQWEKMRDVASTMINNSGIAELDNAIKDGILEFHTFEKTNTNEVVADFMASSIEAAVSASTGLKRNLSSREDKLIAEFVEQVFDSVSNGLTYPLFDEQTASLVKAGIRENKIPIPSLGLDHGKQIGLVKQLLEYLPTFENATIDEILDIRKELDKPLTRFRKAIINFSQDIKSAAWDRDFPPEVDKIYYRDVKPALLDIEESIKSNKFLLALLRKFAEKPAVLPAGSLFSMAISQFSSLPNELAVSLGVGTASAALIYEAYDDWARKKQATEQNLLFFYYGTEKRLNK